MLRDEQDAIDGQRTRPKGQGFRDVGGDPESMGGGQKTTDVVRGALVGVDRDHLQRGFLAGAVQPIRQHKPARDHVGV